MSAPGRSLARLGPAAGEDLREAYEAARLAAQRAHVDSARLVRMLSVIGVPGTRTELVGSVLEALSDLFDADLVLAVRTGAAGVVVEQALGFGDDQVPSVPVLPGIAPVAGRHAAAWQLAGGEAPPVVAGTPVRSAVWLPLQPGVEHGVAIMMLRSDAAPFQAGDLEVLSSVAVRLRLSLEARERRDALARVARAGQRLSRHLRTPELVAEAAAVLVEVTGASAAAVVRVVDGRAVLAARLPALLDADGGRAAGWGGPAESLAVWPEVSQGRTVVLEGTADAPAAGAGLASPLPGRGRQVCAPVLGDEGPVALLWVEHDGVAVSAAATTESVGILAGYLAAALVNTGLYRALADSEERLRLLTDSISDLVVVLTPDGTVTYASPSHARQIGVPPEVIVGQRAFDQVHPDDRDAIVAAFAATAGGGPATAAGPHLELRLLSGDGAWVWVECSLARAPGESGAVVIAARLIGERRRLQDELERRATHDPLTGLANRDLVREVLSAELGSTGPGGVGLLFVDLDRFKAVNDRLGHEAGDELLRQVADRLRGCVRPGDLLARLGGDEFVAVLPAAADLAAVTRVGERALAAMAAPFALGEERVSVGASIGGVLGERGAGAALAGELLRDADAAMYEAKGRGRGRVEVFDDRVARRGVDATGLRADAALALGRGELDVHYQPVVELAGGRVTGFEALLRWHHPARGAVPPAELVPLAEECGAVGAVGDWVLERACAQLAAWQRVEGCEALTVAVNVSPVQLRDPGFAARSLAVVHDHGLSPASVQVEVAEGAEVCATGLEQLRALRGGGVRVAVDDFGAGPSGLGSLRTLPASSLKVDRTLVASLGAVGGGAGELDRGIVRAALALAAAAGLGVVAEGVETEAQRRALLELGCSLGQGHLFAHAARAEEASAHLLAVGAAQAPGSVPRPGSGRAERAREDLSAPLTTTATAATPSSASHAAR